MKLFKSKRCPRCNEKVPIELVVCPCCQLNFQKFESATNAEAKEALAAGEKKRVLLRKGRPSDVKLLPLLLFTIFLGFTGAHYYYVGRYKAGACFTAFFAVGLINAILTSLIEINSSSVIYQLFTLLVLGWGVVLALWLIDIVKVSLNKFKIPVGR